MSKRCIGRVRPLDFSNRFNRVERSLKDFAVSLFLASATCAARTSGALSERKRRPTWVAALVTFSSLAISPKSELHMVSADRGSGSIVPTPSLARRGPTPARASPLRDKKRKHPIRTSVQFAFYCRSANVPSVPKPRIKVTSRVRYVPSMTVSHGGGSCVRWDDYVTSSRSEVNTQWDLRREDSVR